MKLIRLIRLIGMRVYRSIIDLSDIKMYWSEDNLFGGFPIDNAMCCFCFEKLSQYFHVADRPKSRQITSYREIRDFINYKLLENYTRHSESSIDEAMTAFHGTLVFRL